MSETKPLFPDLSAPVQRRRLGKFNWLLLPDHLHQPLLARLEKPEQLLAPPAIPLKKVIVPGREVVRLAADGMANADIMVKRFTPRGAAQHIKSTWRSSPAFRTFHLARQIAALGFFTPATIAAGERRAWGLLRESFLLTHFIASATPLNLFNARCADRRRRLGVVRNFAKLYAAMHDAGFSHADPSQTNFLVVPQPDDRDAIALIDLDGLRKKGMMNMTTAADDLHRLLRRGRIPRRERAWFIATYARARKKRADVHHLLKLIGPLPDRPSVSECALDENSRATKA